MKISQILNDETKWTKSYDAVDKYGNPIGPCSHNACKWCLAGVVIKMTGVRSLPILLKLAKAAAKLFPERGGLNFYYNISEFNDHPDTTFEDVQQVIKEFENEG